MRLVPALVLGIFISVSAASAHAKVEGVCFDMDISGPKNEVRDLNHRIELHQTRGPFLPESAQKARYLNHHYADETYVRDGTIFYSSIGFAKLLIHRYLSRLNVYEGAFVMSRTRQGLDSFEGRTWIYVRCMDLPTAKKLHGFELKESPVKK